MRAGSYCRWCNGGLPIASMSDIEEGYQACPHCGKANPLNRTLFDVLREMEERLTALEDRHAD